MEKKPDYIMFDKAAIEELIGQLDFLQISVLGEVKSVLSLSSQNIDFSQQMKAIQTRMAELVDKVGAKEDNVHQILKDLQNVNQAELIESFKKDIDTQKKEFKSIIKSVEVAIFQMQEEFNDEFFGSKRQSNRLYTVMYEATNEAFKKLTQDFSKYENDLVRIKKHISEINDNLVERNDIFADMKKELGRLKDKEFEKEIAKKHKIANIFKITIPVSVIVFLITFFALKFGILDKNSLIQDDRYYHIAKSEWIKTEISDAEVYKIIRAK